MCGSSFSTNRIQSSITPFAVIYGLAWLSLVVVVTVVVVVVAVAVVVAVVYNII